MRDDGPPETQPQIHTPHTHTHIDHGACLYLMLLLIFRYFAALRRLKLFSRRVDRVASVCRVFILFGAFVCSILGAYFVVCSPNSSVNVADAVHLSAALSACMLSVQQQQQQQRPQPRVPRAKKHGPNGPNKPNNDDNATRNRSERCLINNAPLCLLCTAAFSCAMQARILGAYACNASMGI